MERVNSFTLWWQTLQEFKVSIVLYPLYPEDDADMEFMDAVFKSSLRAFWQTLNLKNLPTNKKVMSRFVTAVYFSL